MKQMEKRKPKKRVTTAIEFFLSFQVLCIITFPLTTLIQ